jgi:hypothetical protein
LEEGEEFGAGKVEVVEGELAGEGEAEGGAGDERGGSEGEEGGVSGFGELAEAMPGGGGDAAELAGGECGEVEEDAGQVAIAEQEIGGAEGLSGVLAAQPEHAGAFLGGEGGRVEAVAGVDEDERGAVFVLRVLAKEGGENEGEAAGGVGGGDFGDGAFWKVLSRDQ